MKEICNFVRWQWSKFELWQKLWIVAGFVAGASVMASGPYRFYLACIALSIILSCVFKWFIWEPTMNSWIKYKQEKQILFKLIKNSDQK